MKYISFMRDVIERAGRLGLNPENIAREILQRLMLYSLAYVNLDRYYIFQGGTALRLVYGSPRFSLDIDLTLVSREISRVSKDILKIRNILAKVLSNDKVGIDVIGEKIFLDEGFYRCLLSFDTREFLKRRIRIKIEVNIGKYGNTSFPKKIIDIEYPFKTAVGVSTKSSSQLLADKIASLAGGVHRNVIRWRDIFDIYWLREKLNADIDEDYLKLEFGSWIEEPSDLKKTIYILENIVEEGKLAEGLNEFQRLLPPQLSREEMVTLYINKALKILLKAFKVLGSEA